MTDFNAYFSNMNIPIVNPATRPNGLKILFYGLAGTGKTSLAGSASHVQDMSPVLYIDLERGSMPLVEHANLDNTVVTQPSTFKEFKNLISTVANDKDQPFATIVIDTIDKLQELILEHWDGDKNTYAKWSAAYDQILGTLNALSEQYKLNVICLTHENREVLENIGSLMITPSFEGKKSGVKLPSVFDIVGRLSWEEIEGVEKPVQVLTVRTSEGMVVKTRFSNLPDMMGNPTMQKINDFVDEYIAKNLSNTTKE